MSDPSRQLGPFGQGLSLRPFVSDWANTVVRWVQTADELALLTPATPPPLTTEKLLKWHTPHTNPVLLFLEHYGEPVGYAELNSFDLVRSNMWIGHVLIDPGHRRKGYGAALIDMLLESAFVRHHADSVVLVTQADNHPAIAAYRAAGFLTVGQENHKDCSPGAPRRMIRMAVHRSAYWTKQRPSKGPGRSRYGRP